MSGEAGKDKEGCRGRRGKVWKSNQDEWVTKEQKMTNQAQTELLTEGMG